MNEAWKDDPSTGRSPGERRGGAGTTDREPPRRFNIPNLLTATRVALLPVLWALALTGADRALAIGTAIAVSTDGLDGILARRLGMRSEFGSRFDSIADHLLSASLLIWLFLLRPAFVERFAPWLAAWVAFGLFTLAFGWLRFRKIGDLHLYSSKAAVIAAYTFAIGLLYFGEYRPWQFAIVLIVSFIAVLESFLVYLTRKDPNERIGSIIVRFRSA